MESLSVQLQPFMEWLLRTSLQASLLIFLIFLVQIILRGKLGIRWHYCLWLLLLVRMVMPWTPQSRASLYNLIPQSIPQQRTEYVRQDSDEEIVRSEVTSVPEADSIPVSTTNVVQESRKSVIARPSVSLKNDNHIKSDLPELINILPLVWLTGALVLAIYVCAGNLNLWRIVKRRHPLTNQKILDLLEDCKDELGIQTILGIVPTDKVKSPALFGFIRPRLLLPQGMIETLNKEELRYVLLHELAHLKRRDIYIGWLMSLLQVLHWFNPLVWLAFYRMRADRELACDALVLTRTQSGRAKDYGRIIVSLVERFSRVKRLPAMAGILENKAQLKRRITMIAQFKKNSYQLSPLAIILIIILGCVSLPDAVSIKATETASLKSPNQPKFTKIQIPTEVSWDMHLSPEGKRISLVSNNKLWIMPLSGQLSPDIPGAPKELDTEGVRVGRSGHAWSADGQWIAFNEYVPEKELSEQRKGYQGIYLVSSEGGVPLKILETYRSQRIVNYRISLSPKGKTLAFSSVDIESKEQHIYTIPVDGGKPKQLVDIQAREPVFSPNGMMIAFVEDSDMGRGGGSLWVVPAQGGDAKLLADAVNASSPIWSPKGDMIAFLDEGDRANKINILAIDNSGEPVGDVMTLDIPEDIAGVWLLAGWGSNNKLGVIFERSIEQGLYTVPVGGGKAMQVAYGGGTPRWTPDSDRVFCIDFPRTDEGPWHGLALGSFPAEGGAFSPIPLRSNTKMSIPAFSVGNEVSPDGKTVVFSGKMEAKPPVFMHNHIWTVPTEGGTPRQLTEATEGISHMFPCWSPDGKTIAFIHAEISSVISTISDVEADIYTLDVDGGKPTALTTESDGVNVGPIAWSPDGNYIAYYSQVDEMSAIATLKIISVDGKEETQSIGIVNEPHPGKEFAWSPDSKQIAFNGPDGKIITIMSVSDGSTVEIETGLVNSDMGSQLDWSPDGETFIFVGGRGEKSEFWVMENFLPENVAVATE